MDNYEIIISLLILTAIGVIVFSLRLFNSNIKLLKNIEGEDDQGISKLIVIHQSFTFLFLMCYLGIVFCFVLQIHLWLEMVVGLLLFFGAVYAYMKTYFNKRILKAAKQKYRKTLELQRSLNEEQRDSLVSEKKYQSILENMDEGYFEVDLNGNLLFFNDSTCRILGYPREELIGINYKAYQTKESVPLVFNVYSRLYKKKSGRDFVEYDIITKNGKKKSIDTSITLLCDDDGNPVGFSGLARDITERKEAEKKQKQLEIQILQAQKLEAIGHLAGGIAHDFNNILTAISGNTKLLMMDKKALPEKSWKHLTNILRAGDRAATLINQVLTFSRQTEETLYPVRFDLILKEAIRFIRSTTSTSIDINTNIKINTKKHHVLADSTQIHQVIMNLCTNAKYALESQNTGTIDISLSPVELNNFTGIAGNLLHGTFFELNISDTGQGMAPEVLAKIFNPFYTTKSQDKGTGLGLSTVHGIVKSCGGDIHVKSEVGKGTTFKVYFPITDKAAYKKEAVSIDRVQGQGNILLLDDESWITEPFGELFSDYGYNVDVYNSSEKALTAVKDNSKHYNVVITDFQMPQMNGLEFAEKVKNINKDIAIIICSGDLSSIPEKKAKELKLHAMVQKPFDDDKLAQIIQEAIDNK
ncbi:MAG: PAS domain S-box protein [Desulfobacteraceae bacterium]|nr:PAS domain S-box protein [Desulfobacteraceae bacterium]